ncbi:hypothetical protein ASZ78_011354 [Callipepla squamata]|uniref:Ig-like domain-containing protein n=1 Tax=Callipepla squamata TaxID=9009 RepID=A0A226NP64_CALSU|nr:hypothetical protein ASZ78_011354 [Callipepla squamata]
MKKIWVKKRFQKTGHSRRFGRFTHDSETGEDEPSDPQVTQRSELQDETAFSTPTGGSDTLVDASMNTTPTSVLALSQAEERSSWSGSQQTVVEKESDANLPVRGPYLRPTAWQPQGTPRQANAPSPRGAEVRHLGVEPLVRASRANLVGTSWGSEDSLSVASDPYGSAFSLYRGRALSLHVTSSVPADYQDTVPEEYEEKIKKPKSQGSTQDSRPPTPMSDASGRISVRASPKLKAASFDERGKFAGRVQDIEHKFSEELSRIKRTPPAVRTPRGLAMTRKHLALSSVALQDGGGEVRKREQWMAPGAASEGLAARLAVPHGLYRRPEVSTETKVAEKKEKLESSDDSYVSAGEDPLEAPIFEIPIQDTAVAVGTEVLLKCIVTANPQPEGE